MKREYITYDQWQATDNWKQKFELYKPKLNKFVLTLGALGVGLCLATPGTNFFIPAIVRKTWQKI